MGYLCRTRKPRRSSGLGQDALPDRLRSALGQQAIDAALPQRRRPLEEITDLLHAPSSMPWSTPGTSWVSTPTSACFPPENSVGTTADELVALMVASSRCTPALDGGCRRQLGLCTRISTHFRRRAMVAPICGTRSPVRRRRSLPWTPIGSHNAQALNLWHGRSAAGNVAPWGAACQRVRVPQILQPGDRQLADRGDRVTAMALLMHWLSRADQVPLGRPIARSICCQQWMRHVTHEHEEPTSSTSRQPAVQPPCPIGWVSRWTLACKFSTTWKPTRAAIGRPISA
jgi:hypothetical protein